MPRLPLSSGDEATSLNVTAAVPDLLGRRLSDLEPVSDVGPGDVQAGHDGDAKHPGVAPEDGGTTAGDEEHQRQSTANSGDNARPCALVFEVLLESEIHVGEEE